MSQTKQSLPGIIAISDLECSALPKNIEMKSLAGIPVAIYESMTSVCFSGNPTCITESEYDNHAQSEKTTLSLQSVTVLPIRRQLSFIVTDVQGQSFIIGHHEAPFPTIKSTGSLGTPSEEKSGYTYEVTLIGRKTLVPVEM